MYASAALKDYCNVVLTAYKLNWIALGDISDAMKNAHEVMMAH